MSNPGGRKPGIPNGSRTNEVYEFCKSEIARTGHFPGTSTIRVHMGWASTSAVNDTLARLVAQQRIKRIEVSPVSAAKRRFSYELNA